MFLIITDFKALKSSYSLGDKGVVNDPHFVVVNYPPPNEIRMFSKQLLKNLAILTFILSAKELTII